MRFIKMHGIGNDYVYVNGFAQSVRDPAALAPLIADRHFGVGGDGLILVLPPSPGTTADVRMRMFNADGSESEMCGNGIRCVCKLAHDHGLSQANPMRVETKRGVLTLSYTLNHDGKVNLVTVDMGPPILTPKDIPVNLAEPGRIVDFPMDQAILPTSSNAWRESSGLDPRMTCVSMGNPHLVLFCRDVAAVPLETLGPFLENQPIFPRRINVHFVQVQNPREVTMRTWERGSGITLACGTGASAVAVAGALTNRTQRQILAHLPGGDLSLDWRPTDDHVLMTGPATEVFTGDWPTPNS
ncbi:MAG: diaminopimelate epimerase [Phycisphaeraceae bacterium]|nr:diaminopimelate epimerase [Phycisphaeraceae bacterium]